MQELHINILTPKKLMTQEEGRVILDLLCSIYPDLTPERYGNYEPLRQVFDPTHPEAALHSWGHEFFWKRKRPHVEGSVLTAWGPRPIHGWITVTIEAKRVDIDKLIAFVDQAVLRLQADFGCIHLAIEEDRVLGVATNTIFCLDPQKERYSLSITTHQLVKNLPDLYWTTVFGPTYVNFFGRACLLSAPAPIIYELEGGAIHLQLSDSPLDFAEKFMEVDEIRRKVKKHLDHNAFFNPTFPDNHHYDVPEFHIAVRTNK